MARSRLARKNWRLTSGRCGGGARTPVSVGGGRSPRWSADGREIFYRNGTRMMAVAVEPGHALRLEAPRLRFDADVEEEVAGQRAHNYDVSPDGQRCLMLAPDRSVEVPRVPPQVVIVRHWTQELQRLVPGE